MVIAVVERAIRHADDISPLDGWPAGTLTKAALVEQVADIVGLTKNPYSGPLAVDSPRPTAGSSRAVRVRWAGSMGKSR